MKVVDDETIIANCTACGEQTVDLRFVTFMVNGHPGTHIECPKCFDITVKKHEGRVGTAEELENATTHT